MRLGWDAHKLIFTSKGKGFAPGGDLERSHRYSNTAA